MTDYLLRAEGGEPEDPGEPVVRSDWAIAMANRDMAERALLHTMARVVKDHTAPDGELAMYAMTEDERRTIHDRVTALMIWEVRLDRMREAKQRPGDQGPVGPDGVDVIAADDSVGPGHPDSENTTPPVKPPA